MMHEPTMRTHSDPAVIEELIDEHVTIDCNLVMVDDHTWAIHGSIAVDGQVILAEFDNAVDAEAAVEQIEAAGAREGLAR